MPYYLQKVNIPLIFLKPFEKHKKMVFLVHNLWSSVGFWTTPCKAVIAKNTLILLLVMGAQYAAPD